MGALAEGALEAGGAVVGVIPQALLDKDLGHLGLTELHVVSSMRERKTMMAEMADAFVALPGGIGTLEEIFEVFTWTQLAIHAKPCAFLNTSGFYDPLHGFLDQLVEQEFLKAEHLESLLGGGESGAVPLPPEGLGTPDHREVVRPKRRLI
jgi:hypothetical protein